MSGLGNGDLREAVWERQVWRGAEGMGEGGTWGGGTVGGGEADQRLRFEDVEMLCKRLNINPSKDDLLRRFQVRIFLLFLFLCLFRFPGHACIRVHDADQVEEPNCGTSLQR